MSEGGKKSVAVLKVIEGIRFNAEELRHLEKSIKTMRLQLAIDKLSEKTPGTLSVS